MKIFIISVAYLLHSVSVLAQSGNLGGQPPGSGARNAEASGDTREMRHRETTRTGCILGQNGKYILITSKPSSILQLIPGPNLDAHVGHKVKITGTIEDVPSAPPAANASPAETNEPSTSAVISTSGQLKVRKIKTISTVCDVKADKRKSWIHISSL